MYHFSSTHLGDPMLASLWTSFCSYRLTSDNKMWKKICNFNLLSTFFLLQPKTWLVFMTDAFVFSLSNTMPRPFLQNCLPNCSYTPCEHCMEWITGTVKPPQPYQGLSPCQRPERGSCYRINWHEVSDLCHRKMDGCSTPVSFFFHMSIPVPN